MLETLNPTPADDWKSRLRLDFEAWLASLDTRFDATPDPIRAEAAGIESDPPDLYSFFEQLTLQNTELRKTNRRTAEALNQWGDTLGRFDQSLEPLRASVAELARRTEDAGDLRREHALVLVEFLDRLRRVGRAFDTPPASPPSAWWRRNAGDEPWRQAWSTQRDGFRILFAHLDEFLRRQGIIAIETVGQPFDPHTMVAVSAEARPGQPAGLVLEELAAGYRRHGELLRTAQVRVTRA